jgi:hypothetical protein
MYRRPLFARASSCSCGVAKTQVLLRLEISLGSWEYADFSGTAGLWLFIFDLCPLPADEALLVNGCRAGLKAVEEEKHVL